MAENQGFEIPEEIRKLIEDIYGYARSAPADKARQVAHDNPYECLYALLTTMREELTTRKPGSTLSFTIGRSMSGPFRAAEKVNLGQEKNDLNVANRIVAPTIKDAGA